jgi:hypothetical protein
MTAPQTPASLIPKPPPVAKSVIAVCAGLFVGGLMIVALERLGHLVASPPVSENPSDPASVRAAMARMTTTNFLLLLAAYFGGSTIGCWIAARMAPSRALGHTLVVGALFVFTISSYFTSVPHPAWFVAASLLAFIAAPFLGTRMSGKR